jgi:hypothetical protein
MDTILKGDHPRIISAKFGWDWLSDFSWTLNFCLFWPIMQIRKKGGWNLKSLLLWNYWANLNQTLLEWSLGSLISTKFGWDWFSSFREEDFF